ncbi:peptidoglycan-binding protein LysM [bacterium]|nr:peptidoglycan-binding protein LysM [bacterium]
MGFFDFVKDAGAKLWGSKEKEAAKAKLEAEAKEASESAIKAQIAVDFVHNMGLDVTDLVVSIEDETATVSGESANQATKEKVILTVGNVNGISRVEDLMTVEENVPEAQFYTVVSGDSLSKISKKYYGNAMKYNDIFEANKPMLADVNKIYPGQVLRIPHLEA